jgi:hypothetical protein
MDYELWVRMALAGTGFKRLDDPPLATYRLAGDTKTVGFQHKVGLEKLAILDWLMSLPELPEKTGLGPAELAGLARRARALASMKVARGYAGLSGQRLQAIRWFARAVSMWPPCLMLFPEYLVKRLWVSTSIRLGAEPPTW